MKVESLDPRIARADVPSKEEYQVKNEMDQWQTYEVFHQKTRGDHHTHVGSLHAPSSEIALIFAKEQYARRMKCTNLWVVKTADVFASSYEDSDMFEPATDKTYREAFGYKNKEMIRAYKARKKEESK